MKETEKHRELTRKRPSTALSFLPLAILFITLVFVIRTFGSDSLNGASQVTLLFVSSICILIGMVYLHIPWDTFETKITNNVASIASALIILLLIGALSGTWMLSGVVPTLIYYGMQIIHPDIFLVSTCLICAIVSVMTGSSWTTIATIGIALMGIGRAWNFSEGWIAGAIISGAYFGDKISPLSDTTILASSSVNVPLFKHIKYLLITTIPSIVIALTVFTIAGFNHSNLSSEETSTFVSALESRFCITPWLLLVPFFTAVMIARHMPPIIILFISTLMAGLSGIFFQKELLLEIDSSIFKAVMMSIYGSTALHTDNEILTELVATRGMAGMMGTIWLIICAMCFGGTMSAGGFVGGISRLFIHMVSGRKSLIASTAATGIMTNIALADQYLCIILTENMFKDVYDRQGYERRLLSRTTEDSVTVTSVLVPWNTCGMTQSTVLGVSTLVYLPYCIFNIVSPIMSIIIGVINYKIFRKKTEHE